VPEFFYSPPKKERARNHENFDSVMVKIKEEICIKISSKIESYSILTSCMIVLKYSWDLKH
jgi:ribosomal protein S25